MKDKTIDENEKKELQKQNTVHEVKAALFYTKLKDKTKLCKENEDLEVLTFDFKQNVYFAKHALC